MTARSLRLPVVTNRIEGMNLMGEGERSTVYRHADQANDVDARGGRGHDVIHWFTSPRERPAKGLYLWGRARFSE